MGNSDFFYEFCHTTSNRVGRLLKKEEMQGKTGFRGIYGFDATAVRFFKEIGSVKGAKHFPVFSDELNMDVDDNDIEAQRIVDVLTVMGIGVEVWNTGGRGYHIGIKHQPIFSKHLPYSQKRWVISQGFNTDLCLYTQNHLFRLPGTRHAKTGRYKVLEHKTEGSSIDLPLVEEPIRQFDGVSDGEFDISELAQLLCRFSAEPPVNGNRNHKMFALCIGILSCGLSVSTAEDIITNFNGGLSDPLEEQEVVTILRSASQTVGV